MSNSLLKPPAGKPKILVFDIETAPYRSYTWGLWKQSVIDVEREWFMLSFAYGWYDIEKQKIGRIDFVSCEQDPAFEAGSDNDVHVNYSLWDLFDEAEVIVGQNHERFDIKKANERFFVHGKTPPSPYATIDTKRIWNRNFAGSAALKYMARKADVALKEDAGGFGTWKGCMDNDPKAWAKMRRYNIADVRATAEVYTRLIPWVNHPESRVVNFGLYKPGYFTCTKCMHLAKVSEIEASFIYRGWHGTGASRFRTLECRKCGGFNRDYQRIAQRKGDERVYLR